MSSKKTKTFIRIVLAIGTITSLFFVPWIILKAWLAPLPDTVQEQVNYATKLGFDGIIVYVDKKGNAPEFYAAGYKNNTIKA